MRIAVVAIQGNVEEHISAAKGALKEMRVPGEVLPVRHSGTIPTCDAIIIPGGESTTLGRLMAREGIDREIKKAAAAGKPIMGTCAGLVLLAKDGGDQSRRTGQHLLGIMDISVDRNAFGGQRESFEVPLEVSILETPYNAIFIRAPVITHIKPGVEVLASFDDYIVAAKQGNVIALAFHPELTGDFRIHRYFFGLGK
ncbi:MAG: pyridoxal 5'-phosphate synthase glutaminase subunit PdxT [Methanosarcinales archaeon]|nr:pyridoxal 5'-phosphate synthase glutaminase subunit PdxT [ANME-2 cluster archaeon]MDF1532306.1 pyridoxal 5'-phosphate synthase glutaminase subunit PdxT [ANME-2 cluster archaeon]MDW7775374.1 pyridoxal 5'-phosphate synthase glutaminase subunit PdxT [Methanosarcinales archaeon]